MDTSTRLRLFHRDISGSLDRLTTDTDATLATGKAGHTIFVQRIIVYIKTDAAQSIAFEDDAATPKKIAEVTASPGDETRWDFDFGPYGVPLTEGRDFEMNVSAAGLAFHVEWVGYIKQTATVTAASLASAS